MLSSILMMTGLGFLACAPVTTLNDNRTAQSTNRNEPSEPTIEANPTSKSDDQWQVVTSENVTLTVTAPGATTVRILYRPAFEDRRAVLRKIDSPSDRTAGKFSTQLKVPSDFAGDVWAEVSFPNGGRKESKPISLTNENISAAELADASYKHNDESARSDKITGGRIDKTTLQPGNGQIRITVNIPAFQLTLWQDGKEVKTYRTGIGRREYPLPDGLRHATQIVFNPEWVPPDSSWVEEHDVVPGERVEADDPRNPLGKIKIPLGKGVLIHQASGQSDLGHLVSHGCVRLLLDELFELSEQIITARGVSVSKAQIEHAKTSKDRLVAKLDTPLIVDLSYDTLVVEQGILHVYPDVYDRGTNTVDNLRAELKDAGLEGANLDDNKLRQMLGKVTKTEEFVVSIADIKAGRFEGQNQPLTASVPKKQTAGKNKGKRQR